MVYIPKKGLTVPSTATVSTHGQYINKKKTFVSFLLTTSNCIKILRTKLQIQGGHFPESTNPLDFSNKIQEQMASKIMLIL